MPITTEDKVDFLWKRTIFSATQTSSERILGGKQAPEEGIVSPVVVLKENYWSETDLLPRPAPTVSGGVVEVYRGATAIRCVKDPTIVERRAWIAVLDPALDPYLTVNRLTDFVPPTVDPSYRVRVYDGDPLAGGRALNALVPNQEWVFDYTAGVLYFPNTIPATVVANGVWIEAFRYVGAKGVSGGSGSGTLEDPGDGTFDDGAVKGWEIDQTSVSTAIDDLNSVLALLLPPEPPPLSSKTLVIANSASQRGGADILLSSNVADNTIGVAGVPQAGEKISRVATALVSSLPVTGFGPGTKGTLSAVVNGSDTGIVHLSKGSETGTYGSLVVSREADFPVTQPGFWQELDAGVTATVQPGVNSFQISHTHSGATNTAVFVYDTVNSVPSVNGLSVLEGDVGPLVYSSGIPHYGSGATLMVGGTVDFLSGLTYLSSGVIQISTSPAVGPTVSIDPGDQTAGLPDILPIDMHPHVFAGLAYRVAGNIHTTTQLQVRGRNPAGDGPPQPFPRRISIMSGTAQSALAEMSVPVVNMGTLPNGDNAGRVLMGNGNTPTDDKTALLAPDWDSTQPLQLWEAAVRGGVLRHDTTNYFDGTWMPDGPDLGLDRAGPQYVTFMFRRRAVSQFAIEIAGSYSGCWVKLPGLAGLLNSEGGWWDMTKLYGGAGIPDTSGNPSTGCAVGTVMNRSGGTFRCTFGTASSTASANNIILVRFRLETGQAVTALSFRGV